MGTGEPREGYPCTGQSEGAPWARMGHTRRGGGIAAGRKGRLHSPQTLTAQIQGEGHRRSIYPFSEQGQEAGSSGGAGRSAGGGWGGSSCPPRRWTRNKSGCQGLSWRCAALETGSTYREIGHDDLRVVCGERRRNISRHKATAMKGQAWKFSCSERLTSTPPSPQDSR